MDSIAGVIKTVGGLFKSTAKVALSLFGRDVQVGWPDRGLVGMPTDQGGSPQSPPVRNRSVASASKDGLTVSGLASGEMSKAQGLADIQRQEGELFKLVEDSKSFEEEGVLNIAKMSNDLCSRATTCLETRFVYGGQKERDALSMGMRVVGDLRANLATSQVLLRQCNEQGASIQRSLASIQSQIQEEEDALECLKKLSTGSDRPMENSLNKLSALYEEKEKLEQALSESQSQAERVIAGVKESIDSFNVKIRSFLGAIAYGSQESQGAFLEDQGSSVFEVPGPLSVTLPLLSALEEDIKNLGREDYNQELALIRANIREYAVSNGHEIEPGGAHDAFVRSTIESLSKFYQKVNEQLEPHHVNPSGPKSQNISVVLDGLKSLAKAVVTMPPDAGFGLDRADKSILQVSINIHLSGMGFAEGDGVLFGSRNQ